MMTSHSSRPTIPDMLYWHGHDLVYLLRLVIKRSKNQKFAQTFAYLVFIHYLCIVKTIISCSYDDRRNTKSHYRR